MRPAGPVRAPRRALLWRIPLRLRLTLAFAAAMAVVLAGGSYFLYARLGRDLNNALTLGLRTRAGDVAALVRHTPAGTAVNGRSPLTERGESIAQIVTPTGRLVDATPTVRGHSLLTAAELSRTRADKPLIVERSQGSTDEDALRLLATRVDVRGNTLVIVVGTSVDPRTEALSNVSGLMLVGGPLALLLASLLGYGLATAALRPVDRMTKQARAIRASEPGGRLAVPQSSDEISRLADTLNAMLERLEVAFATERTFVSDASHELRTPLAILKAELELALRPGRSTAELEEAVRSAAEETDRLVQLAEDLLVVARADAGELRLRRERFRVDDLLETVAARMKGPAGDAEVDLIVDASGGFISADRGRLEQALANLVDNALRYGARTVQLSAAVEDGELQLRVVDDGDGFAEAFLPRAFERFARGDASRSGGGTGLGLAIVKAIATQHGGRVGARNRQPRGAEVWLRCAC